MDKSPLRKFFQISLALMATGVALALAFGFAGRAHPFFDAFSHLRVHLALVMLGVAVLLLFARARMWGAASILVGAAAFATTLPASSLLANRAVAAGSSQQIYRLMQMNLRYNNAETDKVLALIERERPDVITVEEVASMWTRALDRLDPTYPHRFRCRSVTILSRIPFDPATRPRCFFGQRFGVARLDFDGQKLDVAVIHLRWPWPYGQAEHIDALAEGVSSLGKDAIVAGDFNAVPWSASVARVEKLGGLQHVRNVGMTWQAMRFPRAFKFVGLPIDHVLTKGNVIVHAARTLESAGSDHWPVMLEFSLKPPDQAALQD